MLEEIHQHRCTRSDIGGDAGPQIIRDPADQHRAIAGLEGVLGENGVAPAGWGVDLDVTATSMQPHRARSRVPVRMTSARPATRGGF